MGGWAIVAYADPTKAEAGLDALSGCTFIQATKGDKGVLNGAQALTHTQRKRERRLPLSHTHKPTLACSLL